LYRETKLAGCGLLVTNGRISDRALPKYIRYRWFFRCALAWPDAIFVQSDQDRDRYIRTGAPPERIRIGGNLKYDAPDAGPPPAEILDLIERIKPGGIWIGASIMPGMDASDIDEAAVVLDAFQQLARDHSR